MSRTLPRNVWHIHLPIGSITTEINLLFNVEVNPLNTPPDWNEAVEGKPGQFVIAILPAGNLLLNTRCTLETLTALDILTFDSVNEK